MLCSLSCYFMYFKTSKTRQFAEILMIYPAWLLGRFCNFIQASNINTHIGCTNPYSTPSFFFTIYTYVRDTHPLEDMDELLNEGYMNVSALSIIFIAGQGLHLFTFTEEGFLLQSRFINRYTWAPWRKKNYSGSAKCWSPGINSEIYRDMF